MKRFNVVIPREDGGVEVHPMKQWLRQHPEYIPAGLDPTSATSHQLRNGLRKLGWSVQETASEERLMKPGYSQLETTVEAVLGEEGEGDDTEENVAAFALEYQLRDFLAQNLSAIPVEGKRLRLYVDPTGRDGVEYPTAVGPIDILAIDDEEQFVVFELKRARSPDQCYWATLALYGVDYPNYWAREKGSWSNRSEVYQRKLALLCGGRSKRKPLRIRGQV